MLDSNPLEFIDVTKTYDSLNAVDHVSFSIQKGEIFGLLGPNGAGKTTSISMITGLETPSAGEVRVFGHSVVEEPLLCKRLFGVVPQETISHGFFNLWEVLKFHAGFYGCYHNDPWLQQLLERLGLWPHRKKRVRQLSGGMKKRLAIAKALVHRPPLLLLDEPTAGVDIELRDILWDFIRELKAKGTTVLLTTHYLQEAELLCDRVAIIDHGRLQKLDDTKKLVQEFTSKQITIIYKKPISGDIHSPYLVSKNHTKAVFRLPQNLTFSDLVEEAGITPTDIQDVQIREGSLEDVVRQVVSFNKGASS